MTLLQDEKLYYVGGVVRDSFLGVKSFDTDYCYEGNAIEFAKNRGLNIIKTNGIIERSILIASFPRAGTPYLTKYKKIKLTHRLKSVC